MDATIQITQEADFVATRFLAVDVTPATGVPIVGSYTVVIRDGSTDRELMPVGIHRETLFGTAQRSVPFTKNRLFRRNSTITLRATQRQAVLTRAFIVAQGYKIYDEESLDLVRRR